ncbi:hypothetical protein [Aliarcobacter cryaerophilus]|uniref:hypothetical protein n=1 Tax=Aliarcobacter cryaerophilus TaxID=28198 RepID=UPI0011DFD522|nr:hypothetical protein [Aliarcobacter cryaerophilus]
MRFLFRELFKRLRIRYIILILLVLFTFSYISTFSKSTINMLSNEFPLDKSPNPQATEHFIKSMEYKNYILNLHRFVDYDNFLMRPLFNKMNEEYEKGKSLLPETSAEDVYWYVILYRGIYGIGGIPDRRDMSMAFKTTLTKEEYKKHYEEIVDKIKRFAINDFNYDVPRVTEYKFDFMIDLLNELSLSARGKLENYENEEKYDEEHLRNLIYIYPIYKKFSNRYLPLAKQKLSKEFYIYNEIRILYEIIIIDAFQNNNKSLNCSDIKNKILLDRLKELSISKDKHEFFKTIFEDNIWVFDIIKNLKLCPNLKKQADEIFIHFVDKNKN